MTKTPLTTKNTVFFSTANDSYIFNSATSLLAIRQFLPDAELYILSRHISNKNKRFLDRHRIKYFELDLTYLFFQTWEYPIECYYIFAGPELFKKFGFEYSVYLDGDVLCLKNPLESCPPISGIGGVKAGKFEELFVSEKETFTKNFRIPTRLFKEYRINSGVVYMNNIALSKLNFLETCGDLYYKTWSLESPRKGDDSLFALFQLINYAKLSRTVLEDKFNYIPHFKGFKINKSTIFFHFSFDKPFKIRPYQHKNPDHKIYDKYTKTWRKLSRKTSFSKWFKTLLIPIKSRQIYDKLKKGVSQIPFVLKGVRLPILKKRKNLIKPAIKLFWWEPSHIRNFGDVVSQDLIFNLFGYNVVRAQIETCNLIATGSIIELAQQSNRNDTFYSWGSGFIQADSDNENLEPIIFTAVRGKKTLSRIKQNVPLGDPGLLINSAYSIKRNRNNKKVGVVIHYADLKLPITKKFCEDPRFEVITTLDYPENVAKKISHCDLILSSSLHGLVFADSLSIPNIHIKLSNNLIGGSYKFKDYYSGIEKEYRVGDVKKIFDNNYLLQIKQSYQPVPHLTKKQRNLIKAFPFN